MINLPIIQLIIWGFFNQSGKYDYYGTTWRTIMTNLMVFILLQCSSKFNVDKDQILHCANSEHASELLKKYGDDTHIIEPSFIPTILINGSKDNQGGILKNFLLEVCKRIDMPLPPPCLWRHIFSRINMQHNILWRIIPVNN